MALPTLQDAKDLLRVDLTTEDALITTLLGRAKGSIETLLGYALTAAQVTYVDFSRDYVSTEIQLPGPFALNPAPVVTDLEGVVVVATTYLLDNRNGKIRAKYAPGQGYGYPSGLFRACPYTVVATIGLSAHPDYAASLEAVASSAILNLVAHLYENRNPAMLSEGVAGVTLTPDAIPPRILSDLMALPCTSGLLVA